MKFNSHRNCCHLFKPRNQTDDIFLGHKLLGPAALSVGQSYKDFYVVAE